MKTHFLKKFAIMLSFTLLLLGVLGGLSCLITPAAYKGADSGRFSAVKAAVPLKEIAREPHSVFDYATHESTLNYLVDELKKLGLNVTINEYILEDLDNLKIINVQAKLDGKSDDAILLVSYYDSAAVWDFENMSPLPSESYGAADDGYSLATILESIRAIKAQNKPLENDILVLFTDAEELGLLGADAELTRNPEAYQNVRLVINLEARGIKGPAIMFETGLNNQAAMDYYIKYANQPFSYSLATDIYHLMPNGTDFTHFVQRGFPGYNLSVLDNLDYYHTKDDNYQNISLTSLQHYGEQVYPIVEVFTQTPSSQLPSF